MIMVILRMMMMMVIMMMMARNHVVQGGRPLYGAGQFHSFLGSGALSD